MMKLSRPAFVFLFWCISISVIAQDNVNQREITLLNQQLLTHSFNYEKLVVSRGMDLHDGKIDIQKLRDGINTFSFDHPDFAFLFYHYANDTLYHWLFDSYADVIAAEKIKVKADSLVSLEYTLKRDLLNDNIFGVISRGVGTATTQNPVQYRILTDECIKIISSILLPPRITDGLKGKRYLLILPVLNISTFPFSILEPWSAPSTLIDSLSYAFLPGFDPLMESNFDREKYSMKLRNPLIMGNPLFQDDCLKGFPQLAGAEQEVTVISGLFKASYLSGKRASKRSFALMSENSSFIFLATHGWADPRKPLDSSFLAFYDDKCGKLTAREIQQIKFRNNPTVILSACNTGMGQVQDAGIVGLARAFLLGGANTVQISLWSLNDEKNTRLMTLFAEELLKPYFFFPAEHWRHAVLRFRKEYNQDPLYWGAFQTFGRPVPLFTPARIRVD